VKRGKPREITRIEVRITSRNEKEESSIKQEKRKTNARVSDPSESGTHTQHEIITSVQKASESGDESGSKSPERSSRETKFDKASKTRKRCKNSRNHEKRGCKYIKIIL